VTELFNFRVSQIASASSRCRVYAYRASSDCCRPVPTISTSHSVLSRVSMVFVQKSAFRKKC
jgi:hypothetical protein